MFAHDLIKNSGIAFGTSGARGLVADFTPEVCAAFTVAFLDSLTVRGAAGNNPSRLAIAMDNRPSSLAIAAACIAAAQAMDMQVDFYGVIPTPALAFQAMQDGIPAIMVTGSHIPFDRNGLKFYRADGEITKADEVAILSSEAAVPTLPVSHLPEVSNRAAQSYQQRYLSIYPAGCLDGLRIGLYEHSSAGRDLYTQVFTSLGAEVVSLDRTDTFVPIDTEAVSDEDCAKAQAWSKMHQLDLIFSTDGDGDRPLIADENGQWLRGDIVGLLTAQKLGINALAVPVSCNTAIELSGVFEQVVRTKIGSPYVIAAFDELPQPHNRIAGFEANGGFLLGSDVEIDGQPLKALPTRDALLPGLALITAAVKQGVGLSTLVNALPKRYTASDRIQGIPTEQSKAMLAQAAINPAALLTQLGFSDLTITHIDQTDGLRISLSNGEIIHLRPSGNAPELRCYAEAATQQQATQLVSQVLGKL